MERNTLYICTEINAREYDENFLFSIDLLNNTSIDNVVIANQQILKFLLSNLPLKPGFVLVKSAQKNQMKNFSDMSARGHHIICQNAEFCVTWPDEGENDLKMISPDTLKFVKCILTHNSLETKLINEFMKLYHLSNDILELGNIRFLRSANEYNKYYVEY